MLTLLARPLRHAQALELEPANAQYKEALDMAEARLAASQTDQGVLFFRGGSTYIVYWCVLRASDIAC